MAMLVLGRVVLACFCCIFFLESLKSQLMLNWWFGAFGGLDSDWIPENEREGFRGIGIRFSGYPEKRIPNP